MTLEEAAKKFGNDKFYLHSYIPTYEQLFKGRTIRRVLEIGIGYEDFMKAFHEWRDGVPFYVPASSLKMWADYWPEAEIYGCDVALAALINEGRIHSFLCDQSKAGDIVALIEQTGGRFDLIVDDGSHWIKDQRLSASLLVHTLNPGGLYVIEDCTRSTAAQLAGELGGRAIYGTSTKVTKDHMVVIER